MEFDDSFSVQAPIDEVWEALMDLNRVAPCVPGAEVLEQTAADAYKVAIKVKVGPVSMTYKGDLEIVDRDESSHEANMRARARESRGQGTANAKVNMSLTESGGTTEGKIHTDVAISGRAAAMGQGVIKDVSARIIATFASNLEEMLGASQTVPESEPAAAATEAEQEPESSAATASGPAAAPPRAASSPPPPRPTPRDDALPVGSIVAGVIRGRLADPKVLGGLGLAGLILLLLRRR